MAQTKTQTKKKRPGARMERQRIKQNTTGHGESSETRPASLEKRQGSRKQRKG